jgi:hypothetical protein
MLMVCDQREEIHVQAIPELLLEIHKEPMDRQKELLERNLGLEGDREQLMMYW